MTAPGRGGAIAPACRAVFAVVWVISFLPFAVTARYRAPLVPLLLLFASVFLAFVVEEWRRGRPTAIVPVDRRLWSAPGSHSRQLCRL